MLHEASLGKPFVLFCIVQAFKDLYRRDAVSWTTPSSLSCHSRLLHDASLGMPFALFYLVYALSIPTTDMLEIA